MMKGRGKCLLSGLLFAGMFLAPETGFAQKGAYSYKPEGKRDPFVPLVSAAGYLINLEPEEESALRLEGIMYDPRGESMAIINGELRKVGEKVGDAVISRIEPAKIVVIKDNQKVEMELRREE
ncbi:MAG: hypothetical protein WC732_02385 [Candidatus Omnitrophota bacterium]